MSTNNNQNSKGGRNQGSNNKYTTKSREILLEVFGDKFKNLSKDISFIDYDKRFITLKPYAKLLCDGSDDISIKTRKLIYNALKSDFSRNRFRTYFNQLKGEKKAIELRQYLQMLSPKQIEDIFNNM